ncbi:MAG: GTPase HflX [Synechococcales bacterium]|nr:GTPase HflX [Cyanobacteria bacterium REEB444]MEB3125027.1 GTPase HflX [Synechococcales bacterium]
MSDPIFGHLQGLKPSQLKHIRRVYAQRLPADSLLTAEFAERIGAISTDISQPICVYLNRRGQVIRVGVGTPRQTQIPLLDLPRYGDGRLCGIRCVTTQFGENPPNDSTLTIMAKQRLDILVVLILSGQGLQKRGGGGSGYIHHVYLAQLLPMVSSTPSVGVNYQQLSPWQVSDPLSLDRVGQVNFSHLIEDLETEFRRNGSTREQDPHGDRVLLIGVMTHDTTRQQFEERLYELAQLVKSAQGTVVQTLIQRRFHPHPQTVVGEGKMEEIAVTAQTLGVNLIVFDRDLSPSQVRNLERWIGVRVVDRTEVILDIFAQRAQSQAGKLQVELAQLEYRLPRLMGRGRELSRLGGGIGTRGPGETKLESERRAIQRRISRLQTQVDQLQCHRSRLRQLRQLQEVVSVAIVGYTNAGKSTLLNALTHAEVLTADQLFATLDPTTRKLTLVHPIHQTPQVLLLTDTVGFIHELPPSLVDAFRATLEEVTEADYLLHVVDLSHAAWENHITAVETILEAMPITPGPSLLVFNKIDQVESELLARVQLQFPQGVFVSACHGTGLEWLRRCLLCLVNT